MLRRCGLHAALVKDLGGHAYSIRKKDKAAYHAWGTFASPLFTALLATTEQVAVLAGVNRKAARQRMIPILQQTLANYAAFGAAGGFSGPIVRGDVDTVKRHLRVLRGAPVAREVYMSLARAALAYLPGKNKGALRGELKSARKGAASSSGGSCALRDRNDEQSQHNKREGSRGAQRKASRALE